MEARAVRAEEALQETSANLKLVTKVKGQTEARLVAVLREKNSLQRKLQAAPSAARTRRTGGVGGTSTPDVAVKPTNAKPKRSTAVPRRLQPAPLATTPVGPEERAMLCRRIRRLQLLLDDRDATVAGLEAEAERLQHANAQLKVRFRAASAARKRVAAAAVKLG